MAGTSGWRGNRSDTIALGKFAGMFESGGGGVNSLMKLGTSPLVPTLFGDKAGGLVGARQPSRNGGLWIDA